MVIVWAERPKRELQKAYRYISKNSELSAEKFRQDIIRHIQALLQFPEKHPLDKYTPHNDGTWRAFEIHHYRISYRIFKNQIRIVRLRHTSRSPKSY